MDSSSATATNTDYSVRRGQLSAYGRAINSSLRLRLMMLSLCTVIGLLLAGLLVYQWDSAPTIVLVVLGLTLGITVMGLWSTCRYTHQHFIEPDLAFRKWLQQVCDGDLDARIELPEDHRHYKELNFHTRNLASSLMRLSNDMDSLVETQTARLERQGRVLNLLFRLTADVAGETNEQAVIHTTCQYLSEWFESAIVYGYLVDESTDQLQQVARHASQNASKNAAQKESKNAPQNAAQNASKNAFQQATGVDTAELNDHPDWNLNRKSIPSVDSLPTSIIRQQSGENASTDRITVPIFTAGKVIGFLLIIVDASVHSKQDDTDRVLTAVSEQLSLLIEKTISLEQSHKARMIHDRTLLAADIHDSLAQTLLATRYQTTLLLEKLSEQGAVSWYDDILKIERSIGEANQEVRSLIREYRRPLSEHRYADSLQNVIDQFSQTSNIQVFFQSEDPQIRFTPREESVLYKIIGEALTNAHKYSKANMIRVFLQRDHAGLRRILIEDDGVGFKKPDFVGVATISGEHGGDHIGLSIMQERALGIGANFCIDTEPSEGTRVSIVLPPLIESARETV